MGQSLDTAADQKAAVVEIYYSMLKVDQAWKMLQRERCRAAAVEVVQVPVLSILAAANASNILLFLEPQHQAKPPHHCFGGFPIGIDHAEDPSLLELPGATGGHSSWEEDQGTSPFFEDEPYPLCTA